MPEDFSFLLLPGFSALGFMSAIEPLRVANRLAGSPLFSWHVFSVDGEPVEASSGMRLMVDGPVAGTPDQEEVVDTGDEEVDVIVGRAGQLGDACACIESAAAMA